MSISLTGSYGRLFRNSRTSLHLLTAGMWLDYKKSVSQRGGAPEFSGEMIGWVISGFSAGSQKVNIFQKADKNNFQKNWRKNAEKMQKAEKNKK